MLNLVPLAESLGYADPKNLFVYGFSRGGMMTYLALKRGLPAQAAAVVAGPTDLLAEILTRAEMETQIYRASIPGYDRFKDRLLKDRSAFYRADKLTTPLLIQHGGADWRDNSRFTTSSARFGVRPDGRTVCPARLVRRR